MSLILDALKKAKALGGHKPEAAGPASLSSFRFGRSSRAQRIRRGAAIGLLLAASAAILGYTSTFVFKSNGKPKAAAVLATPPPAVPEPPSGQEKPVSPPADTQAPPPAKTPAPRTDAERIAGSKIATFTPVQPPPASIRPATQPKRGAAPAEPITQGLDTTPLSTNSGARTPKIPSSATATAAATPVPEPLPAAAPPAISTPARDPIVLGAFYFKTGDYLKALAEFNKALNMDPLNKVAYNDIGLVHLNTSNTLDAIKAFRQAITVDPKYDVGHNNLGLAYRQAGQDADAKREFELALQINPKNSAALTNLAGLTAKSGNIAQAETQYLKALQMDPSNSEAHYNVAALYEQQGENGKAIEHLKKFLAIGSHADVAADVEKKIEELSKRAARNR